MIRTVIADDEPLAREGIRVRLKAEPDIEIAGEAVDAPHAVEIIKGLSPDLVFLDIQMPGGNGFDVIRQLAGSPMPLIVFVTAFDEHAVRAFEAHALDYLLKPFTSQRFQDALERARRALAREDELDFHRRLVGLLESHPSGSFAPILTTSEASPHLDRFSVRDGDRFLLIRANEVDWFDAAGNYVRLHVRGASYLSRMTLGDVEARVDPKRFARIHRSTIVNLDRVKQIEPGWHGDFDVVLEDGKTLRLSRSYRRRLLP